MNIAERFRSDTAQHAMTVLHDDGLYRHLQFRRCYWKPPLLEQQRSSMYWFDLITVPGALIFTGDGQSFVFRRLEDMFEFFRDQRGYRDAINPQYWAQKLTSCDQAVMRYSEELFQARVKEEFVQAVRDRRAPAGLGLAVREEILDAEVYTAEDAYRVVHEFSFYKDEADRNSGFRMVDDRRVWVEAKQPDFEFHDTYEWDFKDYDWWFLWALHGIVWGIAYYDRERAPERAPDLADLARAVAARVPPTPQRSVTTLAPAGGVL